MRFRGALIATLALALGLASGGTAIAASLYAPSYDEHEPEVVNGYGIAADGTLSPLAGSPFAVGPPGPSPTPSGLNGFAFTPDGGRAVGPFSFHGGVLGMTISAAGSVSPVPAPTLTPSATSVAVSPDGRFAYVTTREFPPMAKGVGVIGFAIEPDGSLSTLPGSPFGDAEVSYHDLAITPDGRYLFTTGGGRISRFEIGAGGSLTELSPPSPVGLSTLTVSPDGRFLFGTETSSDPNSVSSFAIGADGSLSAAGEPAEIEKTGLGFISVAPDGGHVYLPGESAGKIFIAAVAADGQLSVTGSLPTPADHIPAVTAVSPDGRHLYYGHDDSSGVIGVAAIGAGGGLTLLPATVPWASGEPLRFEFRPAPAPAASFTLQPDAPGADASFNALGSTRAVRFEWDFGDGTVLADGGPTPNHAFSKAGSYPVRLTVYDAAGCSVRRIYTGQSTTCPGGAEASATATLDTLPTITALAVKPKKFVPGKKKKLGTSFRYSLSEKAKVRFTISRRKAGVRVGKKCRPKKPGSKGGKSCPIFVKVGALTADGQAGSNKTRFTGVLKGKPLKPGSYQVAAIATDGAKGSSAPRNAQFKVVRPGS